MIDACRRGDGLWFDGGELAALLGQVDNSSPNNTDGSRKLSVFLNDVFRARGADKQS
jgi:Zn-finger nucleic acid-binding protein